LWLVGQRGRLCRPPTRSGRRQPILIVRRRTPRFRSIPAKIVTPTRPHRAPLATYEDLGYRDVFWAARAYEDACDRIALRALLPSTGGRLIEVGAGFGRLAGEYTGYGEVVLLDSSDVHVAAARELLCDDARYQVVLGDALALPFPDACFDAAVCIRVLHHFRSPDQLIAELGRVVRPGGLLVLEYANKRNLKSIARRLLRLQDWSPFQLGAVQYKPFHFDHAPVSVRRALRASGFAVERMRTASLFRLPGLTRRISPRTLAGLEAPLQEPLGSITPGPSVFVLARRI
jgi:ubiquinone/menaquinone biosynthesis C-methylase UbiE